MKKLFTIIIFLLLLVLSGLGVSADIKYSRYRNVRFAYGISYPGGILIPQGEADNGDGQKFMTNGGTVVMFVYGYNNLEDYTLKRLFYDEISRQGQSNSKRVVTYKLLKMNWFVVSGTEGDKIFYKKVFFRDNQFINFEIYYPQSKKAQFDSITAEILKSFKLLKGPFAH